MVVVLTICAVVLLCVAGGCVFLAIACQTALNLDKEKRRLESERRAGSE